ncbi:GntR family transcriptional regulator [Microbacterium chocolatum]|uniref:GntR family transcriptional regulator n=1 Tax=Microbacterium aurantiacum TaxID=162393 RepID=UPI00338FA4B7
MTLTVQRAASLGQQIADILRRRIVRGELQRGDRLTEEGLAEEFRVSRGPVRDAITQLSFEKLVEVHKPRGIYITGLTDDDVEQLYSLRAALEQLAVQRAMRVVDDTRWRTVREAVSRMLDAADRGDHPDFLAADLEFHSQIYQLSDHPRLVAAWEQYLPTFTALLDVTINHDEDLHDSAADHDRLYSVMRSGDLNAASAVMAEHLEGAAGRMRDEIAARQRA